MRRATMLRIFGFALIILGPFLSGYLDETKEFQRWIKTLCMMCIPMGFTMIMISFFFNE